MIEDKLLKQSPFYEDLIEDVGGDRVEKSVITVLSARFGSVSARISKRIHTLHERNSAILDDMVRIAATANDISEFERKLDKMG